MDKTLEAYDITTEFPTVWNESEEASKGPASETTSKNALINQLITNLKSTNTQGTNDEEDPLGRGQSVLETMVAHGVDSRSLPSDLGTYLPSSTYFNARAYLAVVHRGSSFEDLETKLANLKRSMNKREKHEVNVGEDAEQFVTSKQQLDDILANVSGQAADGLHMNHFTDQLDEALRSYTVLMRPLEDNGVVKERYLNALSLVKTYKYVLELPQTLEEHVRNRDHLDFVRDWRTGRDYLHEFKESSGSSDCQKIAAQVGGKVAAIVTEYRAWVWKQLMQSQFDKMYAKYLEMLVDLEVDQNPLYEWMKHQVHYVHNRFSDFFEQGTQKLRAAQRYERSELVQVTSYIVNIGTSKALDSSEVTEHWEALHALFLELQELVNKAAAFWKECALIFAGRKPVGNLKLTPNQETELHHTFSKLVEELAESLPAFLGGGSGELGGELSTGSRIPHNANSLSTVKYLNHINRVLVEIDGEMRAASFSQAVQQVQASLVQLVCTSWLRDSSSLGKLGKLQQADRRDLDETVRSVALYHKNILGEIQKLGVVPATGVVAVLTATIKSFYASLRSSSEAEVDELTPLLVSQEEQLLITINNISSLKWEFVPEFLEFYEQIYGVQVPEANKRALDETADELCRDLFGHYTTALRGRLTRVLGDTKTSEWTREDEPQKISQSVLEALMVLVEIHAKFSVYCPRFLEKVLATLYSNILGALLRVVREFDQLGRHGALQVAADLDFLAQVMRGVHSSADQRVATQIKETVQGLCARQDLWRGSEQVVATIVDRELDNERLAFACFSGVGEP